MKQLGRMDRYQKELSKVTRSKNIPSVWASPINAAGNTPGRTQIRLKGKCAGSVYRGSGHIVVAISFNLFFVTLATNFAVIG